MVRHTSLCWLVVLLRWIFIKFNFEKQPLSNVFQKGNALKTDLLSSDRHKIIPGPTSVSVSKEKHSVFAKMLKNKKFTKIVDESPTIQLKTRVSGHCH